MAVAVLADIVAKVRPQDHIATTPPSTGPVLTAAAVSSQTKCKSYNGACKYEYMYWKSLKRNVRPGAKTLAKLKSKDTSCVCSNVPVPPAKTRPRKLLE